METIALILTRPSPQRPLPLATSTNRSRPPPTEQIHLQPVGGASAAERRAWGGTLIVMPSVIESQWGTEIARRTAVWHADAEGEDANTGVPSQPLRVYHYKGLRWHREDAERQRNGKVSKRTQAQVCHAARRAHAAAGLTSAGNDCVVVCRWQVGTPMHNG